ncbi:MAG: twin-arginine translocation signal domain-containing protein, partial [Gemmatimonadetes bacterium]|nr:twin-arginine translocation signal domain-containing protein [Gemmatimonadota bacterium]
MRSREVSMDLCPGWLIRNDVPFRSRRRSARPLPTAAPRARWGPGWAWEIAPPGGSRPGADRRAPAATVDCAGWGHVPLFCSVSPAPAGRYYGGRTPPETSGGDMSERFDRRDFLKTAALAGVGLSLDRGALAAAPPHRAAAFADIPPAAPLETVRMGFVGVGHQGSSHVENFVKIPGVEIKAICDVTPGAAERSAAVVTGAGQPMPKLYTAGPLDYQRMIDREDNDLVFNATRWELQAPVSLYAQR